MGSVAAVINDILPAKVIIDNMVSQAIEIIQHNTSLVKVSSKLQYYFIIHIELGTHLFMEISHFLITNADSYFIPITQLQPWPVFPVSCKNKEMRCVSKYCIDTNRSGYSNSWGVLIFKQISVYMFAQRPCPRFLKYEIREITMVSQWLEAVRRLFQSPPHWKSKQDP